jgi:hypothetical protein
MLTRAEAPLNDPLVQAQEQVAEAEKRREQQVRSLADIAEGTDARAFAEHILSEIERTIVLSRMHLELMRHLLS